MIDLDIGVDAPEFKLPTDNDSEISLSDLRGHNVVLYFYPKDDTPGCTTESCAFRDAVPTFENLNTKIIGVSKCSVKKHNKFKEKYDLNFPLASDEHSDVCEKYGLWVEKSMYGRKYMGIERSTFLIDEEGKITALWRKVKVNGHVDEILSVLNKLKKAA
jgi:peroxiredoxin Q/BCP